MGTYESYLAGLLVRILGNFVVTNDLGIVLPPDGMMRLAPGLVRVPAVSFVSWDRLPNRTIPDQAIADLVPDLAWFGTSTQSCARSACTPRPRSLGLFAKTRTSTVARCWPG